MQGLDKKKKIPTLKVVGSNLFKYLTKEAES